MMGFVRIFWKNNVQEAYLRKMSIPGQIVSEIVAQLCNNRAGKKRGKTVKKKNKTKQTKKAKYQSSTD